MVGGTGMSAQQLFAPPAHGPEFRVLPVRQLGINSFGYNHTNLADLSPQEYYFKGARLVSTQTIEIVGGAITYSLNLRAPIPRNSFGSIQVYRLTPSPVLVFNLNEPDAAFEILNGDTARWSWIVGSHLIANENYSFVFN